MSRKMKRKFQPPMGTSLPSNPMVPSNNLLDFGGEPKIETEDWRSQLQPDSRQQVINKIMWTMKRDQPVYHEEGLNELRKDTERFEAKIFAEATSLLDYLWKTSEKDTMGTKSQPPVRTSLPYNPMVPDHKPLDFGGISGIVTGDLLSQPQPNRQRQILKEMMYKRCLYIRYGGSWDDNKQRYTGGQLKGITVSVTINYNELRDRMYKLTEVNSSEFNIIMRVKYKLDYDSPPAYIMDDDDVQFLIYEATFSRPMMIFISLEQIQQQTTFENIEGQQACKVEGVIPTSDGNETDIFSWVASMRNDNAESWESYTTQHNISQKRGRGD